MTQGLDKKRKHQSLVASFSELLKEKGCPEIFATCLAFGCISPVLGRRVFIETPIDKMRLNSFRMLVTPPGLGKTVALRQVKRTLDATGLPYGPLPDSITSAALMDLMSDTKFRQAWDEKAMDNTQVGTLITDEYGYTFEHANEAMLRQMCKMWDGETISEARRSSKGESLAVRNPYFNIIAGTQIENFNSVFDQRAWSSGFSSRIVFYIAEDGRRQDNPFTTRKVNKIDDTEFYETVAHDLKQIHMLAGPDRPLSLKLTDKAEDWMKAYWADESKHTAIKLETMSEYNARRPYRLFVDSALNAISKSNFDGTIDAEDMDYIYHLHLELEHRLETVVRRGISSTDGNVMKEAFDWLRHTYIRSKKAPIHQRDLYTFITSKVDAHKAKAVYANLLTSNAIEEVDKEETAPGSNIFVACNPKKIRPNLSWTARI